MLRNHHIVLALLVNAMLSFGEPKDLKIPAFPESEVVSSPKRIEDVITGMYVTHNYPNPAPFVKTGKEIGEYEIEWMKSFRTDPEKFFGQKPEAGDTRELYYIRYHLGEPTVVDELLEQKKAGIDKVMAIIDANDALTSEHGEAEDYHSRFAESETGEGTLGQAIGRLEEAGFKFRDKTHGIYSTPLYNTDRVKFVPLMHDKNVLAVLRNKEGVMKAMRGLPGTANSSQFPRVDGKPQVFRYNRAIELADPRLLAYDLEHTERMMRAYAAGKETKGIEQKPPLRVNYRDGSIEIAYTDGQINPNFRIAKLFERAALEPGKVQLKQVTFSHFVLTNKKVIDALEAAMKVQKDFEVSGIFDNQFLYLNSYGLAASLDSFDVLRPQGLIEFGAGREVEGRTNLYGYQRGVPGRALNTIEGPPVSRHLWHDKSTIVDVVEDGKAKSYIFTGSFNASNNIKNAERQMMIVLDSDHPFAKEFHRSIKDVVQAEKEYVIPLPIAVMRNELGRLTGHTDLELKPDDMEKIREAIKTKRFAEVEKELLRIAAEPSTLTKRPDAETVANRIKHFREFLEWYSTELPHVFASDNAVRKTMSIATILGASKMEPHTKRAAIRSLLYDWKEKSEEKRQERLEKAWGVLAIEDELPKPKDKEPEKDSLKNNPPQLLLPCPKAFERMADSYSI